MKPGHQLHDCALNSEGTNAVAEPGVIDYKTRSSQSSGNINTLLFQVFNKIRF